MQIEFILSFPVTAPKSGQESALEPGPEVADFLAGFDLAEINRAVCQFFKHGFFIDFALPRNRFRGVGPAMVPVALDASDLSDFGSEQLPFIIGNTHSEALLRCCLKTPIQL